MRSLYLFFFLNLVSYRSIQVIGRNSRGLSLSSPTNSSLLATVNEFQSSTAGVVLAYEIQYKGLYDNEWTSLQNIGSSGNHIFVSQVISIRVDPNKSISSGSFELSLTRLGLIESDTLENTHTKLIPYDVSASNLKTYLSQLSNVKVKEVKRCDEYGLDMNSEIGRGGIDDWEYGCPYGSFGGYRWLVVFECEVLDSYLPQLIVTKSFLGSTWSGPGNQITVASIHSSAISPSLCKDSICSYRISGLSEGTAYVARYRSITTLFGWLQYSDISEFAFTLESKPPSRPQSPILLSSLSSSITLSILPRQPIQAVTNIVIEYRPYPPSNTKQEVQALDIEYSTVDHTRSILISNLLSNTSYTFRLRYVNDFGSSPWSKLSPPYATDIDIQRSLTPYPPTIIKLTSASVKLSIKSPGYVYNNLSSSAYRIQYRHESMPFFQFTPDVIISRGRGHQVFHQEISTRTDLAKPCDGYFWLSYGLVSPSNPTISTTPPLLFNATAAEMQSALLSIAALKQASSTLIVNRRQNTMNGYTWTIELPTELSMVFPLLLYRHSLYQEIISPPSPPFYNNSEISRLVCFYAAVAVVTSVLPSSSSTSRLNQATTIDITNLHPESKYYTRVVLVYNNKQYISDIINFTTANVGEDIHDNKASIHSSSTTPSSDILSTDYFAPSVTYAGDLFLPGKMDDPDYVPGTGMGGVDGKVGSAGHCAIIFYNRNDQQPYHHQSIFYTGSIRYFRLPSNKYRNDGMIDIQEIVTIKCWGAGGGSTRSIEQPYVSSYGGGAGYAQISVIMNQHDMLEIMIGGSGGGGHGGKGYHGGNGAHGGGASIVKKDSIIILVAAGGGGAGYSDYCCAYGGAGGTDIGFNGTTPASNTPWPLTSLTHPTPITHRYDFTSAACPMNISGEICISQWDELPGSLPPGHKHLQNGAYPSANYQAWAEPGHGGSQNIGGSAGMSGSFVIRTTGDATIVTSGAVALFTQYHGISILATAGKLLYAGDGANGFEGGGGGGIGYYGGGGGGSGVDGAGGGGGSSYFNITQSAAHIIQAQAYNYSTGFIINTVTIIDVNDTSAMLQWMVNWQNSLWGIAYQYDIELAVGEYSLDFKYLTSTSSNKGADNTGYNLSMYELGSYAITNLSPNSKYQARVIPIFRQGRGRASNIITIHTTSSIMNFWEPILTRSSSSSPNPSPRLGHSLTLVQDTIYMFGGRTDGISCAGSYKDTLNLGSPESGRYVYPCVSQALEVQELWKLNLLTYEWLLLDDTAMSTTSVMIPPPRQQHNAIIGGDGDLYIYGGKCSSISIDEYGSPVLHPQRDIVYGDFYKLHFLNSANISTRWNPTSSYQGIPQTRRMFAAINISQYEPGSDVDLGDGINKTTGQCIDHITISISFQHDCLQQLRFSLMGPGATTLSSSYHASTSAYEVLLLNQRSMHAFDGCVSGMLTFIFDDTSTRETDSCCLDHDGDDIIFKPEGKLSSFYGASPVAQWTLVVEDMIDDTLSGELITWEIKFNLASCSSLATGTWTNLTQPSSSLSSQPPARYDAMMISYDQYLFLYGGRDAYDRLLSDLHRYDIHTYIWQQLQPIRFKSMLNPSSIGANLIMTSQGLLRYGGYYRQPYLTSSRTDMINNRQYSDDVWLLDPVTMQWQDITIDAYRHQYDDISIFDELQPYGRYHAAAVVIPSSHVPSLHTSSLSSTSPSSSHINYAGSMTGSILILGGSNGATGTIFDSSSGGLLSDTWMLRLANWSTLRSLDMQSQYMDRHCNWRRRWISQGLSSIGCISANASSCELRDLLLLTWCNGQTFTLT